MRPKYKEYKNFFNLKKCNSLINNFKENVQHHRKYRDAIILRTKEVSPILVDTLLKDFNIILNYERIIYWPNSESIFRGSGCGLVGVMNQNYEGQVVKDNDFSAICYLNNNVEGERILLQNKIMDPEIGKVIVFNSQKMEHEGEETVSDRFAYISWWKRKNYE